MKPTIKLTAPFGNLAEHGLVHRVGLILAGSALLALSARITVPMVPVPMTMQTLALLLIAATFGARLSLETLLAYLAQGAVGLPVFAGGAAGVAHFFGPTGGFLVGFALSAFVIGWLVDRGHARGIFSAAIVLLAGHLLLFVPGVLWLAKFIGFEAAFVKGFWLFVPGTLLKTALALALLFGASRAFPSLSR